MEDLLDKIKNTSFKIKEGASGWSSPSNIALIKYWGKYNVQIPANPSISFSLDSSRTETRVRYSANNSVDFSLDFKFDDKENADFEKRILTYLNSIAKYLPFLKGLHLSIASSNSFPHSSGIASSASSMSALSLNLMSIFNEITDKSLDDLEFYRAASFLSRLGSGSACRSVYGGYTVWGESEFYKGSSDLFGLPVNESDIAPVFKDLCDDILIIEKGAKKVSSSAGHGLMHHHPFAKNRFELAKSRMSEISEILSSGDVEAFGKLIEKEALMLHSMMMTSDPYFILFKPQTLAVIEEIWEFRKEHKIPVYFTLDAGANVHLIYPSAHKVDVEKFIKNTLLVYCENEIYLCDRIGEGPKELI